MKGGVFLWGDFVNTYEKVVALSKYMWMAIVIVEISAVLVLFLHMYFDGNKKQPVKILFRISSVIALVAILSSLVLALVISLMPKVHINIDSRSIYLNDDDITSEFSAMEGTRLKNGKYQIERLIGKDGTVYVFNTFYMADSFVNVTFSEEDQKEKITL